MLKILAEIIKIGITYNAKPTIYISSTNKGKTQIGWTIAIG
jgi:hypothetical protein